MAQGGRVSRRQVLACEAIREGEARDKAHDEAWRLAARGFDHLEPTGERRVSLGERARDLRVEAVPQRRILVGVG